MTLKMLGRVSLARRLYRHLRLAFRLCREPRVPWLLKLLPLAAAGYLVSPLDLIPDVIPVIGEIDDVGIIVAALLLLRRLSPSTVVAFHEEAVERGRPYAPMTDGDDFIEADYRKDG